jgi:hypothetical protein
MLEESFTGLEAQEMFVLLLPSDSKPVRWSCKKIVVATHYSRFFVVSANESKHTNSPKFLLLLSSRSTRERQRNNPTKGNDGVIIVASEE